MDKEKGQGLHPPNPSRFGAAPTWTRIGPPKHSRFGAVLKWTRIGPPQPFTICDLERPPKWTKMRPPQPFTIWSSHMDKDWTPQPFTIWSGSQMDKDWTPPTLHDLRFGAATQMDKDEPAPTFHDLERFPNGQGLDPPRLGGLTADFLLPNSAYKMCHLH